MLGYHCFFLYIRMAVVHWMYRAVRQSRGHCDICGSAVDKKQGKDCVFCCCVKPLTFVFFVMEREGERGRERRGMIEKSEKKEREGGRSDWSRHKRLNKFNFFLCFSGQQVVRCMGGHAPAHWKTDKEIALANQAHMNSFPVPEGPWQEYHDRRNSKWNMQLGAAALVFVATIVAVSIALCLLGEMWALSVAPNIAHFSTWSPWWLSEVLCICWKIWTCCAAFCISYLFLVITIRLLVLFCLLKEMWTFYVALNYVLPVLRVISLIWMCWNKLAEFEYEANSIKLLPLQQL